MQRPQVNIDERARIMEFLLDESKTYSIAFMCGDTAVQKDDQTKAQVIQQSKLYRHFQVFQPGEVNLAGFEAVHKHVDKMQEIR